MFKKNGLTRREFIKAMGAGAAAASVPVYLNPRASHAAKMQKIICAEGPFISKGPNMIAFSKGFYKKMGLDVQYKWFFDGGLIVAPLLAGEVDIGSLTPSAGFFNAVARGGDLMMFLDGGTESRRDRSYVVTVVSQKLYDEGIRTPADLKKVTHLTAHMSVKGSINQYGLDKTYMAGGVDPRKIRLEFGLPQPKAMQLMMKGGVHITNYAYHFAWLLEKKKKAKIISYAADSATGAIISCSSFSKKKFDHIGREHYVRYAMAYLHAVKLFNEAAGQKSPPVEILNILSKLTVFKGEKGRSLMRGIRPHWAWTVPDAKPNLKTLAKMQDHWAHYRDYVKKTTPVEKLADASIAEEAAVRLKKEKPFG
ncbi:MAG: twin-arginine translocation signal domain-containing protein [bacterium]